MLFLLGIFASFQVWAASSSEHLAALVSEDTAVSESAAAKLRKLTTGQVDQPPDRNLLVQALQDPRDYVRNTAAEYLSSKRFSSREIIQSLRQTFDSDSNYRTRGFAMRALLKQGVDQNFDVIATATSDPKQLDSVKEFFKVKANIQNLKDDQLEILGALKNHVDASVREFVADILIRKAQGTDLHWATLIQHLDGAPDDVMKLFETALGEMKVKSPKQLGARLKLLLSHQNPKVKAWAEKAMKIAGVTVAKREPVRRGEPKKNLFNCGQYGRRLTEP